MDARTLIAFAAAHPLTLVVSAALAFWWHRNAKPWRGGGPFELPILGAIPFLLRFRGDILGGIMDGFSHSGFKTFTVKWITSPRFHMVSDPRCVEHVLKTHFDSYPKGETFCRTLRTLLGGGIFASDGPQWKTQRQLFSHVFSDSSFRTTILDAFVTHGSRMEAILRDAAASGAPLDMSALFHRFTLDSIALIAFGVELHALENPNQAFVLAFDAAQAATDLRFFTPGWRLLGRLGCLRSETTLRRAVVTLDAFCSDIINARRTAGDWRTRSDVLSRAMAAVDEVTGKPLYLDNDSALRDIILSFMIAGRDTTAQALSWAVLQVARAPPDVEARLADEARACSGGSDASLFAPSYDAVTRELRFTRSLMMETLRLFPSVPKEWKYATRNDTLPDGTRVSAGDIVTHVPYAMGRSVAVWGEDAREFVPTRFLAHPAPSAYKFTAFNAGPRVCLGQAMALAEASFVLALTYRSFSLHLSPPEQGAPGGVRHADSLTLPQARGVTMTVRARPA